MLHTNSTAIAANDVRLESVKSWTGGAWHRLACESGTQYMTLCGIWIRKPAKRDKWTGAVSCAHCLHRESR